MCILISILHICLVKKLITTGLLSAFFISLNAQNNINPLVFNPELYRDGILFKGVLFSNNSSTSSEPLTATLTHNGRVVATQTGVLPLGSNNLSEVNVIQSSFFGDYESLLKMGLLPEGNYKLCVGSSAVNESNCVNYRHTVRPSPLCVNLVQPFNESEVNTQIPTFIWASQATGANGVASEIKISEPVSNKRREVQHFSLPAHFQKSELTGSAITYPVNALPLEQGKHYHWNVNLIYNGMMVCRSEVWTFKIPMDSIPDELPINLAYINLDEISDMPSYFILGELKLQFKAVKPEETAEISVFDSDNKRVKLKEDHITFEKNNPFVVYNFEENGKLDHLKEYTVNIKSTTCNVRLNMTYVSPALHSVGN